MRVLVLDNYDSFTWNLVQAIEAQGGECIVCRCDAIEVADVAAMSPDRIVFSPGPFGPERTGVCQRVVQEVSPQIPTLGVCLGMQVIAASAGARVVPSGNPVHGKTRLIHHDGSGVLRDLPSPFEAGLYHSLVLAPESIGEPLVVFARSETGVVMGCRLRGLPVEGLLFHPESFLTPLGGRIVSNFLAARG